MIEKSVYFDRLGFGIKYFIGQNAKDNFDILDLASPDDWWFHVLDKPSCHVIAKLPGKFDRDDLRHVKKQGAVLCRQHSSVNEKEKNHVCESQTCSENRDYWTSSCRTLRYHVAQLNRTVFFHLIKMLRNGDCGIFHRIHVFLTFRISHFAIRFCHCHIFPEWKRRIIRHCII